MFGGRVRAGQGESPGEVTIDRNDAKTQVAIEYGNLQPGRRVRSDALSVGIITTGDAVLTGQIFADNLPQPKSFTLTISATIERTRMTVAELTELQEEMRFEKLPLGRITVKPHSQGLRSSLKPVMTWKTS